MSSALQEVEKLLGISLVWHEMLPGTYERNRLFKAKRNKYRYTVHAGDLGLHVLFVWKIYGEDVYGDEIVVADSRYGFETPEEAKADCEEYAGNHRY